MLTQVTACPACLGQHDRIAVVAGGAGWFFGNCPNTGEQFAIEPGQPPRLTTETPPPAAPVEVVEESVQDDLLVDPYFHADD